MTITNVGFQAIFNANNTGVELNLTHLQLGSGQRTTDKSETTLVSPIQFQAITAAERPSLNQVRMSAVFPITQTYDICEIGIWAGEPGTSGSVLFAYWASPDGKLVTTAPGVDFVFTHDMMMDQSVADSINVVIDPNASSFLSLLNLHLNDAGDPHSQYLLKTNANLTYFGQHTFKVESSGYSKKTPSLFYKNGKAIIGGIRSYNLATIRRSDCEVFAIGQYDLNISEYEAERLRNDLNNLDSSVIAVLYCHDNPLDNRLYSGLPDAIYRCGGSRAIFASNEFAYRSSYILVGIPGCGEGNGIERYSGKIIETGDPDSYCEISFQVKDGDIVGAGATSSIAFGYVSKNDLENNTQSSFTSHTSASDPHPQYTTDTEAGTIAASAITAHTSETNPHKQYALTSHTHSNASQSTAGFMSADDKTKLDGISAGATAYTHPAEDGSLHVPATGTTNSGKVLMAGETAGSLMWVTIDITPPGQIGWFARNTPPTGWLEANGQAIDRSNFKNLFDAIGTTFGAGNGVTTFNIPDLRGEFVRGWDNGRGVDENRGFGTSQDSENKSHTHEIDDPGHTHSFKINAESNGNNSNYWFGGAEYPVPTNFNVGSATTGISVKSTGGSEARPRNVAMLVCIKY